MLRFEISLTESNVQNLSTAIGVPSGEQKQDPKALTRLDSNSKWTLNRNQRVIMLKATFVNFKLGKDTLTQLLIYNVLIINNKSIVLIRLPHVPFSAL